MVKLVRSKKKKDVRGEFLSRKIARRGTIREGRQYLHALTRRVPVPWWGQRATAGADAAGRRWGGKKKQGRREHGNGGRSEEERQGEMREERAIEEKQRERVKKKNEIGVSDRLKKEYEEKGKDQPLLTKHKRNDTRRRRKQNRHWFRHPLSRASLTPVIPLWGGWEWKG